MENLDLVYQETVDSSPTHSRRLNVIADKLYSLSQTRQSRQNGPFCHSFFQVICFWWHQPQVGLFLPPGSTTNCLNLFHWGQTPNINNDAISLPWEDLYPYAFPLVAILGKVVEKLQDYPCSRITLIAPRWPKVVLGSPDHVKSDSLIHCKILKARIKEI